MRKLFFLVLFVSGALIAQAGPWFAGLNSVSDLVSSVTDADGNDLQTKNGQPIIVIFNEDGTRMNDSVTDADGAKFDKWDFNGIVWTEKVTLPFEFNGDGTLNLNFLALKSVDWSNFGYIQKADKPIIWQQYDIYDPSINDTGNSVYHNTVQDNDLEYLESLNFSGNKFIHFELDGGSFCPVTSINFSNNPTLETLVILNCLELAEVNITNNGFTLAKIYEIAQTVETDELKYAPQGTTLSFPVDAVDLSADVTLGTTATTIVWTGAQPVSNAGGVFSFAATDEGKAITAALSNSELGSDAVTYTITLTKGTGINPTSAEQKIWTAGKQLFITSNTAETMRIYTMDGRLVKQQNISVGTSSIALENNLYLVRFDNGAVRKVLVK